MKSFKSMLSWLLALIAAALVYGCGDAGSPISQKQKQITTTGMLANINFGYVANTEADLWARINTIPAKLTNPTIQRISGQWQVAWGPVITAMYQPAAVVGEGKQGWTTNNVMVVLKGTDPETQKPLYAVAVGATNVSSYFDWIVENFNVFTMADWIPPAPLTGLAPSGSVGRVSTGNALAMDIHLAMKDPTTKQTLVQFAASLPKDTPVEFGFTGISLAGGLTPLVALRFQETMKAQGVSHVTTSVWPMAGPAVGDANFARYAAAQFGDRYHSMRNVHDMVPQVWQSDMMAAIPALFADPAFNGQVQPIPSTFLTKLNAARAATMDLNYARIAPDREYTFKGNPMPASAAEPGTTAPYAFFDQAHYQHVKAYLSQPLGLTDQDMIDLQQALQ